MVANRGALSGLIGHGEVLAQRFKVSLGTVQTCF